MFNQHHENKMTLDKETRMAVALAVRNAAREANEIYTEQWLTGDQLCKTIGLFTKEWLKRYGNKLPRECVRVKDENGVEHRTCWCYPLKKILRLIAEGQLRMIN